jgi:hypothetical protein
MPNPPPESELDMVTRHVRQGEANVTHQREHIAWRRAKGMDTELAESVLDTFVASLDLHRAHLARLRLGHVEKPSQRQPDAPTNSGT